MPAKFCTFLFLFLCSALFGQDFENMLTLEGGASLSSLRDVHGRLGKGNVYGKPYFGFTFEHRTKEKYFQRIGL